MTTAGHIAKAMRDIDDEVDRNDWVTAVIDVPGVGGGVVDRLIELRLPVTPYNGGEGAIDKERFLNARAEDYWTLRELFVRSMDVRQQHRWRRPMERQDCQGARRNRFRHCLRHSGETSRLRG